MNSMTHDRPDTVREQADGPAVPPSQPRADVPAAFPADAPISPKNWSRKELALLLGGVGVLVLLGVLLTARIVTAPAPSGVSEGHGIVAEDAWARAATRPGDGPGGTSAVYLRLRNQSQQQDRLLGATSDAAVTTEVHRTLVEDGVMRMRPAGPVEAPAGGTVTLQPGGLHIMLIELRRDLAAGERLSVTLHFEQAGDLLVDAEVRAPMQAPMQAPMTLSGFDSPEDSVLGLLRGDRRTSHRARSLPNPNARPD